MFVTTRGRQKAYFGSKRPISRSTFSADFWSIFRVPLTKEKPPYVDFSDPKCVDSLPLTMVLSKVLKEFYAKAAEATALVQQPEIFDSPYKGMQSENGLWVGGTLYY